MEEQQKRGRGRPRKIVFEEEIAGGDENETGRVDSAWDDGRVYSIRTIPAGSAEDWFGAAKHVEDLKECVVAVFVPFQGPDLHVGSYGSANVHLSDAFHVRLASGEYIYFEEEFE